MAIKDQELLIRINGTAKNFIDELDRVKKKTQDLEKSLTKVAKLSAAAFIALTAAVGAAVVRFAAFEKNFTNGGRDSRSQLALCQRL